MRHCGRDVLEVGISHLGVQWELAVQPKPWNFRLNPGIFYIDPAGLVERSFRPFANVRTRSWWLVAAFRGSRDVRSVARSRALRVEERCDDSCQDFAMSKTHQLIRGRYSWNEVFREWLVDLA